jgi:ribosomal protein S18 acetylase RimI-like enzyme
MDKIYNNVASGIYDNRVLNKFTKLLSEKYTIFAYKNQEVNGLSIIFYISENIINMEDMKTDEAVGFISFYIDDNDKDLTILFIRTNSKFTGNGIGTFLMILAASYVNSSNKTITKIRLDDDSDNSWQENNIYTKLGLKYINSEPEPEMEGTIQAVVDYWDIFKPKYESKLKLL